MGQQQVLLIVLGMVIVGIAAGVGLTILGNQHAEMRKEAIIADISLIAEQVNQYRARPAASGGGGGSYAGYVLPPLMSSNAMADFSISANGTRISIQAVSAVRSGDRITLVVDATGVPDRWTFEGEFHGSIKP